MTLRELDQDNMFWGKFEASNRLYRDFCTGTPLGAFLGLVIGLVLNVRERRHSPPMACSATVAP